MNKYDTAKSWIDEISEHPEWSLTEINWLAVDELKDLITMFQYQEKYHHPKLVRCTCGHNRRKRFTQRIHDVEWWGLKCNGCGKVVTAKSELGVKRLWNEINIDNDIRK